MSHDSRTRLSSMVALALLGGGPGGCTSSNGTSDAGEGTGDISVGVVTPQTGDLRVYGNNMIQSLRLAIDEINGAGGVLGGRKLTLDIVDDGTQEQGTATGYATLLNRQVPLVFGPEYSSGVVAVRDQLKSGGTLTISSAATSPALSALEAGGNWFRLAPSDAIQGVVLAELVVASNRTSICIVHRQDSYGNGLADALVARLPSTITTVRAPYDPSTPDLSSTVDVCSSLRDAPSAGMVLITYTDDGIAILDGVNARGWDRTKHQFFLCDGNGDGLISPRLQNTTMLEGALGTIPSGPDESTPEGALRKAFVDKFTEKYSEAPYLFQENVYDAAYVGIAAIELAGTTTDRGAIVSALSRIGAGGEARVGDWPAIRERIRAEGRLSLQGASGPVAFSADSPDRKAPYFMTVFEMRNGSPTRVEVRRVDRP